MRLIVGTLAVLLFATMVVMGQELQVPFPQAANPSITTNADVNTAPSASYQHLRVAFPTSMSANQSSTTLEVAPSAVELRPDVDINSNPSFPSAADPSLATNPTRERREWFYRNNAAEESPFPAASNPASNQ